MRFLLIFLIALLTACGSAIPNLKPFKMDVQQGNVVTSKMLLKLRPGMTKSQVKYIMGTPLVVDSFHTNRWDYFYQMRQSGQVTEKRRVILDFEKDLLVRVRGDVVAEGSADAVKLANEPPERVYVKPVTPAKEEGLIDKLKFWDRAEKTPAVPAASAEKAVSEPASGDQKASESTSTEEVPSASILAVPLATAPAVIEPTVPAIVVPESNAQAPKAPEPVAAAEPVAETVATEPIKLEAAPEVTTPATPSPEPTPVPVPVPVVAPVEPVKVEPVKTPTNKPASKTTRSGAMPEKLIFRMDKTLDLERGNQTAVDAPAPEPKAPAPVKPPELAPPAKETSFFDKMLEKIGF
jgi:outer membrane protein assembly factor BamE